MADKVAAAELKFNALSPGCIGCKRVSPVNRDCARCGALFCQECEPSCTFVCPGDGLRFCLECCHKIRDTNTPILTPCGLLNCPREHLVLTACCFRRTCGMGCDKCRNEFRLCRCGFPIHRSGCTRGHIHKCIRCEDLAICCGCMRRNYKLCVRCDKQSCMLALLIP